MLRTLVEKIETARISFSEWLFAFLGVVAVRLFFENFSSPTPSFPAVPDWPTMLHYTLFYIGALVSLSLALRIFIKEDIARITKFLLFGLPIIWFSPLFDLFASRGAGYQMSYIFSAPSGLLSQFFTVGSAGPLGGLTPGLHTELIAIVIGICVYSFIKTKNIARALGAALLSYVFLFFWMVLPSLIAIASGSGSASSSPAYLIGMFASSRTIQNFIAPNVQFTYAHAFETIFNIGMAYIFYLLDFALFVVWFRIAHPAKTRALAKNFRPTRMVHYLLMIAAGFLVAAISVPHRVFLNWVDFAAFIALMLTFFCACLFAIGSNDVEDVAIDRVSDATRPLVSGAISASEMKEINFFFVLWAFVGGYVGGYWSLFAVLVFTASYYIYSVRPLRLKRIPILSSFLVALVALSAAIAGFYFSSLGRTIDHFPPQFALLIVICFTLGVNIKDIKDIEGDRADGVWTIPVIFGSQRGKMIVGALLAAGFLLVPVILGAPILYWPSLIAAVAGYYFVTKEPFREWRIFAIYFCYAGTIALLLWPR